MDLTTILYTIMALSALAAIVLIPWKKVFSSINTNTSSGQGIDSKTLVGIALIVLMGGLGWWFWGTLSESLWWRVAPLVLIAFICFRWAKSKDKSLPANIGNAALIALAVVLLVSAPGRSFGEGFDAKAEAVTNHGVTALMPASFSCPNESDEAAVGGTFEIKRSCGKLRLTGNLPRGVTYQVLEGHGDLDFEDNLKNVNRPFPNVRIFEVLDTVPEDTVVKFRIVSAEESAELDRTGAEAKPATDLAESFGEFKP